MPESVQPVITSVAAVDGPSGQRESRVTAALLGIAALLMLLFMAMHPAIHSHDASGFFEEMGRKQFMAGLVHGTLIAVMAMLLVAFAGFADHLRTPRPLVRAGLVAYAMGVASHTLAALINGFVVPGVTARYAAHLDAADEETLFAAVRPLLALCGEINRSAATMGVIAMSAAVVLWSIVLLRRSGGAAVGALGLVCGLIVPAGLALGRIEMDVHGFMLRVIVQSVWYLAVAVQLWRGRL